MQLLAGIQLEATMLEPVLLRMKRFRLLRQFKCFEVKHEAEYLGRRMASAESDEECAPNRQRLQEAIQEVCAKKNIGHVEMNLIEDDLNDYVNVLVREAFKAESKKLQKRELVDGRIKIKRVDGRGPRDTVPASEP